MATSRAPWSLATRLVEWFAVSAFGLVFCATGFLYYGLTRSLEGEDDDYLREKIKVLRSLLGEGEEDRRKLRWEVESERDELESPSIYLRVWNQRDNSFLETRGMSSLLPPGLFPPAAGPWQPPPAGLLVKDRAGRPFRVMAVQAAVGTGGGVSVIQAATDLSGHERLLVGFRWLMLLVLGASACISLALGYRITRNGLRPLEEISATTRRIGSSTLNERVCVAGLPLELHTLADNFNTMLDRLEDYFARLSRFSADIAHELRTPLNCLRGESELALNKARRSGEYREVLSSGLEECARLSRIVDSLLFIATSEGPESRIERERVERCGGIESFGGVIRSVCHGERSPDLGGHSGSGMGRPGPRALPARRGQPADEFGRLHRSRRNGGALCSATGFAGAGACFGQRHRNCSRAPRAYFRSFLPRRARALPEFGWHRSRAQHCENHHGPARRLDRNLE